jgi:hypothetical protein
MLATDWRLIAKPRTRNALRIYINDRPRPRASPRCGKSLAASPDPGQHDQNRPPQNRAPHQFPILSRNSRPEARIFTPPPGTRPGPRTILCLVTGTEFAQRDFFEGALPVALAGSFAAELAIKQRLSTAHEYDACCLHPHREAARVKFANRP